MKGFFSRQEIALLILSFANIFELSKQIFLLLPIKFQGRIVSSHVHSSQCFLNSVIVVCVAVNLFRSIIIHRIFFLPTDISVHLLSCTNSLFFSFLLAVVAS